MVSTGPMPKAMDAEFHISMQAAFSACGRPWPPQSEGDARPFHPAAAQSVYASFQPGGVVTWPSLNGVPNLSPTWLSGAMTSVA
jgi:hypothetical protein